MQSGGKPRGGPRNRKNTHQPGIQTARILSPDGARFSRALRFRKNGNFEKFSRQLRHRLYQQLPSRRLERKQGRIEHEGRFVSDRRGGNLLAHRDRTRKTRWRAGRIRARSGKRRVFGNHFPARMNAVPNRREPSRGYASGDSPVRYGNRFRPERMDAGRKAAREGMAEACRTRAVKARTYDHALERAGESGRKIGYFRDGGIGGRYELFSYAATVLAANTRKAKSTHTAFKPAEREKLRNDTDAMPHQTAGKATTDAAKNADKT